MNAAPTPRWSPSDVSAVICTMNSQVSIEACLTSLRRASVGQIIVVDAYSADGTRQIAEKHSDVVLNDPGIGLGNARNIGIAETTGALILNMGSDNVMPPAQLERMIDTLDRGSYQGVSAQTRIEGTNYPSKGLNAWRKGRFRPGPARVIGTPTLFIGDMLRTHPYDPERRFSDDSELCERWANEHGATFAISDAEVLEVGKTSWSEVQIRARMYGISDEDVYRRGAQGGWSLPRKVKSLAHPLTSDFLMPLSHAKPVDALSMAPFLAAFTALRYRYWIEASQQKRET
jgi:glycosyltransferase involved in cell wall biosynthesis